jgi:hypothetical protein
MPETEHERIRREQLEARTARVLRKIVDRCKRERDLPPNVGMALFLFDFGGPGTGNIAYASTARREDMIAAVREWLKHVED